MVGESKLKVNGQVVRIVIVAAHTKRLLLVQSHGRLEYWELPGGKVEQLETPEAAAARELREETGLTDILLTKRHQLDKPIPHDPHIVWRYHFFVGVVSHERTITIDPDEIAAYQWVTIQEAVALPKREDASRYFLQRITPPKGRHY